MKCIEMHSRQSGFTYSASGPSTRDKEHSNLIKKTADSRHIYQNWLGKDLHRRHLLIKYYTRKHLI